MAARVCKSIVIICNLNALPSAFTRRQADVVTRSIPIDNANSAVTQPRSYADLMLYPL